MTTVLVERTSALSADLCAFMRQEQRLPRLGDPVPPWHYRGWLLPYVMLIHKRCPHAADRWGYHLRTLDAGKLLDEPIPQIVFGVVPSVKREPVLSGNTEPLGAESAIWSGRRARVAQLVTRMSARSEGRPGVMA